MRCSQMQKQDESTKTDKIVQIDDVCSQTKKQGQVPIKFPRKKKRNLKPKVYILDKKKRIVTGLRPEDQYHEYPHRACRSDKMWYISTTWAREWQVILQCSPLQQRRGHQSITPPVFSQLFPQTSPSHIPTADELPTTSSPVTGNRRWPPWPIPQSIPCSKGSPLHTPLKRIWNLFGKRLYLILRQLRRASIDVENAI